MDHYGVISNGMMVSVIKIMAHHHGIAQMKHKHGRATMKHKHGSTAITHNKHGSMVPHHSTLKHLVGVDFTRMMMLMEMRTGRTRDQTISMRITQTFAS